MDTVVRLTTVDTTLARAVFTMMAGVFYEPSSPLTDDYLQRLLARDAFIALAALRDGEPVGGITAHVLPLTRRPVSEIFIYDIAVRAERQRQGIGRLLISALRHEAATLGIDTVFVPADNEDDHALEFYRAVGGSPAPVTFFTFGQGE